MDSVIDGAQNSDNFPAPLWNELEKEYNPSKSSLGAYPDIYNPEQISCVPQKTLYSGNPYFGSLIWRELRELDVSSFNSLYSNAFEPQAHSFNSVSYPVEVSGAVTDVRETAVDDILKYMVSNGILDKGDVDAIHLDDYLPDGVLGRTEYGSGRHPDVTVSYCPEIFNKSYKYVSDPLLSEYIIYMQSRTIKHENVHEKMLSHPDAYGAKKNLDKMRYSDNVFKGLLEGMAELETIKSYEYAKKHEFAEKVREESPYKKQLRVVERIEEEFRFSDAERVYRGARGFYEALAKGLLDKATVKDMLGGIELKSDFMPAYKHSGKCGKCYGGGKGCGSGGYAS